MTCKNQPFSGPVENRIGYHDGYAGRTRKDSYVNTDEYKRGYAVGKQDRADDAPEYGE